MEAHVQEERNESRNHTGNNEPPFAASMRSQKAQDAGETSANKANWQF
jgi:hypothetical protein